MRKFLTVLLSLMMVVTMMPIMTGVAFAVPEEGTQANPWHIGATGHESEVWAYLDGTTLHIEGIGEMKNVDDNQYWRTNEKRELITTVNIASGVTSIGNYAFQYCKNLKSVNFGGSNLSSVGTAIFKGCSSLESITIPEGVEVIKAYMFQDCTSLKDITIPEKVTNIGNAAFYNCAALESITIPEKVTKIGQLAFTSCTNLKTVRCLATTPTDDLGTNAFGNCAENLKIYVPFGTGDVYRNNEKWEEYKDEIVDAYMININKADNGTVTANKMATTPSDLVKLTVTPDEGYKLTDLKVLTKTSSTNIETSPTDLIGATEVQFNMPEDDVTVTATFVAKGNTTPSNLKPLLIAAGITATTAAVVTTGVVVGKAVKKAVEEKNKDKTYNVQLMSGVLAYNYTVKDLTTGEILENTSELMGGAVFKAPAGHDIEVTFTSNSYYEIDGTDPYVVTIKKISNDVKFGDGKYQYPKMKEKKHEEQTKPELSVDEVKEAVDGLAIRCNTKKTADGTKVYAKVTDGDLEALEAAGYTVSYKFYRSKHAKKGYKLMKNTAKANYTDTKGADGKMYYYKAKVVVTDKDGNEVAITAIKDCKYGNRKF